MLSFPLAFFPPCFLPSVVPRPTYLGNSTVALLVINLSELHCRFNFFLGSITDVTCEDIFVHSNFNLAARLNIVLAVDPLDGRGVSLALGGVG